MIKHVFLFAVLLPLVFTSCTEEMPRIVDDGGPYESILLSNFTGHLIRRSGTLCGEGINVKFVVSTISKTDEYFYAPDTYYKIPVKVKRGENITVKAYEITDNGLEVFLIEETFQYNPNFNQLEDKNPEIVLCPKNVVQVFDFD